MIHYACRASWKIALAFVLVFATLSTGSNTMRSAHAAAAEPYIGEIQLFPYGFAPDGWMFAAGQVLTIQSNTALYSTMGTAYGGNGRTNFAIPNLTGLSVPDGMAYYIATNGIFPQRDGAGSGTNNAFLGEVHLFPYFYVPGDWLKLDGSVKNKDDYPELSSLLNPSGNSTFTLPNLSSPLSGTPLFYAVAAKTSANQVGKDLTQLTADDYSYLLTGEVLSFLTPMQTSFFSADGTTKNVMDQQALFALLGTRFGGNGYSTFGLPNMSTNPNSFSTYIVPGDSSHGTLYPSRDSNAGPGPSDLAVTSTPYTVGSGSDALFNKTPMLSGGSGTGVSLRTLPQHGTVVDLGSSFNYKSDNGYVGSDSFTVRTYNTNGFASGYSTININVVSSSPPTVSGVSNNGMYNHAVTPIITNNGASVLNNQPYTSGTPVTAEGSYTLVATNSYGTTQVKFTIDLTPPTVSGASNGGRYTVPPTITLSDGTATLNGAAFTSGTSITGEGNYTLVATDAANNSTTITFSYYAPRQLTFDSAGGTSVTTQNLYYGDHGVQPTAPTRTGYTFTGWYTDAARTQLFDFANTTITTSTQLYAGWSINQYTVSFNSGGGTAIANVPVNYGATISEPTPPTRTGYTFNGWYTNAGRTQLFNFTTAITANLQLYGEWITNQYVVSFDSGGGTSIAAVGIGYGSSVSAPTAPTRTGYTFTGWYTDAARTQLFNFTNSVVTANIQLYAGWSINQYTVSFNSDGGTAVANIPVNYGLTISAPTAPTRTNYTFIGWYTDAAHTQLYDFANTMVTANTQLYAGWSLNQYTVSFNSDGGTTVASVPVNHGLTVNAPTAPTRTGYAFTGWYTDAAHTQLFDFANTVITANTQLYAGWSINQYTISFDSSGGTAIADRQLDYGSLVSAPAVPTRTGYTFTGWYTDAAHTQRFDFATATVVENIQLYAGWTLQSYTVTFDAYQGANIPTQTIPYGTFISHPIDPVQAGHTFTGWYADAAGTQPFDFQTIITAPVTVYAGWSVNQYTASFDSQGGTAVNSQALDYGSPLAEPQQPSRIGYTFTGWYSDAATGQRFDFTTATIRGDLQLYAGWERNQYTVSFDTYGGSVMRDVYIGYGDMLTLPNAPTANEAGSIFAGWFADPQHDLPFDFSQPIVSNVILYAKWAVRVQQITFDTDGGTAIGDQSAAYGDRLSRPADPQRAGYTFAGWYTDAAHSQPFDFAAATVTADMTLYAKWNIAVRTVTFQTDGGTAVQAQAVNNGASVSRPADPARIGYTFTGWYTDTAHTRLFDFGTATVTADMTLYAGWTLVPQPGGGNTGNNGGGGGSNSSSNSNTTNTNNNTATQARVLIPAGQAGELRLGEGVRLQVPAGAADQPLEISASQMNTPPTNLGSDQRILSPVIEFIKNMQENFKVPVKLTMSFDPATLRSNEKLAVFYQTAANTPWVLVDNGTVEGNTIMVEVNHFTRFAVMAVPATAPVGNTPTTGEGTATPRIDFSDINSHWAAASIREAAGLGIVKGYADGTFHPGAQVTRAEFAAMLVRMLQPASQQANASSALSAFTDGDKIGAWAQNDIATASALGWIKGNADGSFRPNAPITRAEMAVMVSRAMATTATTASGSFADEATIPTWAKAAATQMQQSGLMTGRANGAFDPSALTTRAEAAQVLIRAHHQ